jgi:hypothetical protein
MVTLHHLLRQKLFATKIEVFLFKDYVSIRVNESDVIFELSQVPQSTCLSKNKTGTDSTKDYC